VRGDESPEINLIVDPITEENTVPNVEIEYLENRQARLVVQVDPDRVQKALRTAARRISKQVNIPGFRKGKAPYHVIARVVGEQMIYDEALEPLGQEIYTEALDESDLEPFAAASLDNFTLDPFELTFTVPLVPTVALGDYREVRLPYEQDEVTDDDVEGALQTLRREQATLEPVERVVELGDVALLDILGTIPGDEQGDEETQPFISRKGAKVLIAEDATYPVAGFPQQVVGMSAEEEREFEITLPDDDEDLLDELRGKTIHFEVVCHTVYLQDLPELDDEFAQDVGEYENVADLRAGLRDQLEDLNRRMARERYLDKVFDHLIESVVEVSFPPVMLENEIDRRLREFDDQLKRQGLDRETYLQINDMSEEDLREAYEDDARAYLQRGLILTELVSAEKLEAEEEEIEDQKQTLLLSLGSQGPMLQQFVNSPETRERIADQILTEKAVERLIQIAKGEAPELTDEADDEPAEPQEDSEDSDSSEAEEEEPEVAEEVEEVEESTGAEEA
jgi:trigger factor